MLRYYGLNEDASRRDPLSVEMPPGYYADGAAFVAQLNAVLWQAMKEAWCFARKHYLGYDGSSNRFVLTKTDSFRHLDT